MKRRAYRDQDYWAKPVPGFGDAGARMLLIGLAPGAHGANRTGRMFTGDSSGNFLYRALFETGFASQPTSISRDDGLLLTDAYISAAVRCAPPDNKPLPGGDAQLPPVSGKRIGIVAESESRGRARTPGLRRLSGHPSRPGQNRSPLRLRLRPQQSSICIGPGQPVLISSFHPSQQNTSTGKLTEAMFRAVFLPRPANPGPRTGITATGPA